MGRKGEEVEEGEEGNQIEKQPKVQALNFIGECHQDQLSTVIDDLLSNSSIARKISEIWYSDSEGKIVIRSKSVVFYKSQFKDLKSGINCNFKAILGSWKKSVHNFSTYNSVDFQSPLVSTAVDKFQHSKFISTQSNSKTKHGDLDSTKNHDGKHSSHAQICGEGRLGNIAACEDKEKKEIIVQFVRLFRKFSIPGSPVPESLDAARCRAMVDSLIEQDGGKQIPNQSCSVEGSEQGEKSDSKHIPELKKLQSKIRKLERMIKELTDIDESKDLRRVKAKRTFEHGWSHSASTWKKPK